MGTFFCFGVPLHWKQSGNIACAGQREDVLHGRVCRPWKKSEVGSRPRGHLSFLRFLHRTTRALKQWISWTNSRETFPTKEGSRPSCLKFLFKLFSLTPSFSFFKMVRKLLLNIDLLLPFSKVLSYWGLYFSTSLSTSTRFRDTIPPWTLQ